MVFRKQWRNNNQWFEWKQIERFGKQLFLSSTKLHSFVDTLFPASIQYFTRHPGFTLLKNLERPSVTLPFAVGAFVFFLVPILLSCTDTTFLYRYYFLVPILLSCTDTTFLYRHYFLVPTPRTFAGEAGDGKAQHREDLPSVH